jgi:mycofactocin system glycosyltransferase
VVDLTVDTPLVLHPDGSWHRCRDRRSLLAGSPLVLFRLTERGAQLADAIERGAPLGPGHERLSDRLVAAGAAHPIVTADTDAAARTTVVVPAHAEDPVRLQRLVDALHGVAAVIVVDDASPMPLPPLTGATVVRRDRNGGPAAARNDGLALVDTELVLFLDADVRPLDPTRRLAVDIDALAGHLRDPHVVAVAPRIAAAPGQGAIAAYEAVRSPLDLGDRPARVQPGSRVAYVPSAALLARTEALRAADGFAPGLRFGEDVDLVWRLVDGGGRVRYAPEVVLLHEVRADLRALVRQRAGYGSSAAPLSRRHPGALAPLRLDRWSAAAWTAAVAVHPVIGAGITAVASGLLARRWRDRPDGTRLALRVAAGGTVAAARGVASATTRPWWPLALTGALVSRRVRRAVVLAAVVPGLVEWATRRPRLDPLRYLALRVIDDAAYGTGVWRGARRERTLDPLRPEIRPWRDGR